MALINCPECNNECSSSALTCPKCGHPFQTANPKNSNKSLFIIIIGIVVLLGVALGIGAMFWSRKRNEEAKNIQPSNSNSQINNATVEKIADTNKPLPNESSENIPVPIPTPEEKASLNIEVAIIYNMGGAQPVAREKFYLLDSSAESIMKGSGMKVKEGSGVLGSFGLSVLYPSADTQKALTAIKKHVKYSVLTDFKGKANFENVKPDTYYLFGITTTRKGFSIWNLKKKIVSGENSEILDNKNAEVAF
jgi:hypothetical protein